MLELHAIALLLLVPNALKCPNPSTQMPGYEWRQPVFLVDDVVIPKDGLGPELEQEQTAWIGITCWNPATDSFDRNGMPVVRILTKTLVEATRAPLLRLIKAQENFRSRHRRYATDLESLEAFGLDSDVDLKFEASESRWSASTPSGKVAYQCSANEASARTVDKDGQPQLDCAPVDALALRSLRARYDAGR